MKIFRVLTEQDQRQIRQQGLIEARPVWIRTYDDYGQEVDELENRAYYCESLESAEMLKASFEYWRYNTQWQVEEYEAEVIEPRRDYKTPGGWYSRQNIRIRKEK